MAYTGRKQKFVTSIAVQKCLLELWNNGFIDKEDCRIVSDSNQLEFHKFSFKVNLKEFFSLSCSYTELNFIIL